MPVHRLFNPNRCRRPSPSFPPPSPPPSSAPLLRPRPPPLARVQRRRRLRLRICYLDMSGQDSYHGKRQVDYPEKCSSKRRNPGEDTYAPGRDDTVYRNKEQKYYAVSEGRKPGVYNSWERAAAEVNRYPGAIHKKYSTSEEAQEAVDTYHRYAYEALPPPPQPIPYQPLPVSAKSLKYSSRDGKASSHGYPYSGSYNSSDVPVETYHDYSSSQPAGGTYDDYGGYGSPSEGDDYGGYGSPSEGNGYSGSSAYGKHHGY